MKFFPEIDWKTCQHLRAILGFPVHQVQQVVDQLKGFAFFFIHFDNIFLVDAFSFKGKKPDYYSD